MYMWLSHVSRKMAQGKLKSRTARHYCFLRKTQLKTDKLFSERKTHYIELENHIHTFTETHGNGVALQG